MMPSSNTPWLMITGGDVVLPGGEVLAGGTVLVSQGIIQDVTDKAPASLLLESDQVSVMDATGHWVTPGLIDQHLHGAFGIDFNQSTTAQIQDLLRMLPQYGITAVLPTLITAPKLDMIQALSALEEIIVSNTPDSTRVLGIHLEGPFLNPEYRGAHPQDDLLPLNLENLEGLLSPNVKRVTLAPELDTNNEVITYLLQQGILCAIGHSGADFATASKAIEAGASCATHLFNAMARFSHRAPGIVSACLVHDEFWVELITDGKHLAPETILLTLKAKPFEKAIVISDCNALAGLAVGTTLQFGKQQITVYPEGPLNEEGRLAGSTMLLPDSVRNLVHWGLLTFPEAVQMATLHPATHLGEVPLFGQIAPGAMADMVLWNQIDLCIQSVLMAGELIAPAPAVAAPSQL